MKKSQVDKMFAECQELQRQRAESTDENERAELLKKILELRRFLRFTDFTVEDD